MVLRTVDSRFQVLNSTLCQGNLGSGFQLLVRFRIPWAVFWIPKARISDSIRKFSQFWIPQAKFPGFRNPNSLTLSKTLRHIYSKKYTYCCPLLERPQNPFVWCFEFLFSFVLLYLARFHLHYPQCYRFLRHCSLHRLSSELFSHLWLFYCFLHVLFLFVDQQTSILISFLWQNNKKKKIKQINMLGNEERWKP